MTEEEKKGHLLNIEESLQSIRPYLVRDGGNVKLVDLSDDYVVSIKLTGACKTCLMSDMTMKNGIELSIKKVLPQVTDVIEIH